MKLFLRNKLYSRIKLISEVEDCSTILSCMNLSLGKLLQYVPTRLFLWTLFAQAGYKLVPVMDAHVMPDNVMLLLCCGHEKGRLTTRILNQVGKRSSRIHMTIILQKVQKCWLQMFLFWVLWGWNNIQ